EFVQIVERLREAEPLAVALDDQGRLARLSADLASAFVAMGSHDLAVEAAQRALAIGETCGDFGARVLGIHFLGLGYRGLGKYRQAVDLLRQNVDSLKGDLIYERFGLHGPLSVFTRNP